MNKIKKNLLDQSGYRPEIDGLRAFAVLSVVLFHSYPGAVSGGFIGVDIFFVVSGFLISGHIFESLKQGSFNFFDFFSRRIRRIFPALILVVSASLVFGWFVLLAEEYSQLGKHAANSAVFFLNFSLVDESGYFDNASETKPLMHLWSLAVEEQFYLIWPLILMVAWRLRYNLLLVTFVFSLISFFWGLVLLESHPGKSYFLPYGRFWEFLSGSVLAWLTINKKEVFQRLLARSDLYVLSAFRVHNASTDGQIVGNLVALFGISLLLYGVLVIDEGSDFPGELALVPVVGAMIVISLGGKTFVNRFLFMNPVSVWIGLISYPLYLWHWPALAFPRIILGESLNHIHIVVGIAFTFAASVLTFLFLERPVRNVRASSTLSIALVSVLSLIGFFGLYVYTENGLEFREANTMDSTVSRSEYFDYLEENFFDCSQNNIKELAPIWHNYLRCKQSSRGNPRVVLVGDSHAEHLFIGLAENYDGNVAYYISGLPMISRTKRDYIFDHIIENDSVKTVVLTARYELHLGRGDIVDLYSDFSSTIDALKASNKSVVLVGDTPQYDVDPASCIGRRFAPIPDSCALTPEAVIEQKSAFHHALEKLANDYNVEYIDLFDAMCANGTCLMHDDGVSLYRDRDHLSIFGSKRAGSFLAKELERGDVGGSL